MAKLYDEMEKAEHKFKEQKSVVEERRKLLEEAESRYKELEADFRTKSEAFYEQDLAEPCKWNTMFAKLKEYREKHGDCMVPQRTGDKEKDKLGMWVCNQRHFYRLFLEGKQPSTGHIKAHRIEALESIGFVWNVREGAWSMRYAALKAYREKNGDCRVPKAKKDLRKWVDQQRYQYRDYKAGRPTCITADRIQKLEEIGFEWEDANRSKCGKKRKKPSQPDESELDELWNKGYEELSKYQKKYGSCRVFQRGPGTNACSGKLRTFVAWQRREYKNAYSKGDPSQILTQERVSKLEALGFEWTTNPRLSFEECNTDGMEDMKTEISEAERNLDEDREESFKKSNNKIDQGKAKKSKGKMTAIKEEQGRGKYAAGEEKEGKRDNDKCSYDSNDSDIGEDSSVENDADIRNAEDSLKDKNSFYNDPLQDVGRTEHV